jgi:branched-chain amino acid transport system permease protein
VAWLIERLVLRHLVNQEGTTLLMATLGITYFLDGLGQTIFGSDIYKIDVGMPKEPIMAVRERVPGRHPDQQGRPVSPRSSPPCWWRC